MHVIIDYGLGNTASVLKAVRAAGFPAEISSNPSLLENAETLILPGVGSFRDAMHRLEKLYLIPLLNNLVLSKKKRFLGICLGLQLLAEWGTEDGVTQGLGWIKGKVEKIPFSGQRIPHMGWNNITPTDSALQEALPSLDFYFMHSYYFHAEEEYVTSTVEYGIPVTATIQKGNIFAAQFHPEKSQEAGLAYLRFVLGKQYA